MVSFQIDLLHLGHQRISRVCTGTLIVEGVLHHLIQRSHEIFFLDTVLFDRPLDADLFLSDQQLP